MSNVRAAWVHCDRRSSERYGLGLDFQEYVDILHFLRRSASQPGPDEREILVEFEHLGRQFLGAWDGSVLLTLLPAGVHKPGRLIEIVSVGQETT